MSKPIQTIIPGFKVRIHIHPAIVHAFSTTEPVIMRQLSHMEKDGRGKTEAATGKTKEGSSNRLKTRA